MFSLYDLYKPTSYPNNKSMGVQKYKELLHFKNTLFSPGEKLKISLKMMGDGFSVRFTQFKLTAKHKGGFPKTHTY